jgi:hypothetical protein
MSIFVLFLALSLHIFGVIRIIKKSISDLPGKEFYLTLCCGAFLFIASTSWFTVELSYRVDAKQALVVAALDNFATQKGSYLRFADEYRICVNTTKNESNNYVFDDKTMNCINQATHLLVNISSVNEAYRIRHDLINDLESVMAKSKYESTNSQTVAAFTQLLLLVVYVAVDVKRESRGKRD